MPRTPRSAAPASDPKADKFKELASKRTTKALDTLDVLGNCFNRTNYAYTDEQVDKIFTAISEKVAELRSLTEPEAKRAAKSFQL